MRSIPATIVASSPVPIQPQGQGRGARRVTAEQKRLLQAKAAQRSKNRQGSGASSEVRVISSPVHNGGDSVEEATSVMAVQSLNQNNNKSTDGGQVSDKSAGNARLMPRSPSANSKAKQGLDGRLDIPLEDLSGRGKPRSLSLERIRLARMAREVVSQNTSSPHAQVAHSSARSHSLSPHRSASTPSSSILSRKDPHRQSAPIPLTRGVKSGSSQHGRQSEGTDARRSHSLSSSIPSSRTLAGSYSSDDSADSGRARSWSDNPTLPKSLLPALAPPVSLVDTIASVHSHLAAALLVPQDQILLRCDDEDDEAFR